VIFTGTIPALQASAKSRQCSRKLPPFLRRREAICMKNNKLTLVIFIGFRWKKLKSWHLVVLIRILISLVAVAWYLGR